MYAFVCARNQEILRIYLHMILCGRACVYMCACVCVCLAERIMCVYVCACVYWIWYRCVRIISTVRRAPGKARKYIQFVRLCVLGWGGRVVQIKLGQSAVLKARRGSRIILGTRTNSSQFRLGAVRHAHNSSPLCSADGGGVGLSGSMRERDQRHQQHSALCVRKYR